MDDTSHSTDPVTLDLGRPKGGLSRVRAMVLLRTTSAIATTYLIVAGAGLRALSPAILAIVTTALLSNLLLPRTPRHVVESRAFTAALMIVDTGWMTAALLLSGQFGAEFFFVYFFVLFLAGISESLGLVAVGAVIVSATYLVAVSSTGAIGDALRPASLVRVPFFLAVATFYSYLVDRVRSEKQTARAEARNVASLREAQDQLVRHARRMEQVNARLETEIDARRRAEALLSHANDELSRANASKSEFVSMVAHELKTPLGCIKSSVEMLRRCRPGSLDENQERFVDLAQRNVGRLTRIVGDLLDLSRIDAGLVECDMLPTDLSALLDDFVECHRPAAEERQLLLELRVTGDPSPVLADGQRVEQIVTNLVTNAMKFTPPGGRIVVEVAPVDGKVEVSVTDTGIGLTEEDRRRVFERFFQVRDKRMPSIGSGLGLSIASHLARCHGGEIEVASRVGQGSRFSFRLASVPIEQVAHAGDLAAV